jgi:hypothetical protein
MLLQRVNFQHQTRFDLYDQLSTKSSSTLISNGAADHLQGSTGWIIAIRARRIVRGQCPVPGFDPRSYRAKGYGMLCGLLFLKHLRLYCGHLNLIPPSQLYCNNL